MIIIFSYPLWYSVPFAEFQRNGLMMLMLSVALVDFLDKSLIFVFPSWGKDTISQSIFVSTRSKYNYQVSQQRLSAFTYSKPTAETPDQCVKSVQS